MWWRGEEVGGWRNCVFFGCVGGVVGVGKGFYLFLFLFCFKICVCFFVLELCFVVFVTFTHNLVERTSRRERSQGLLISQSGTFSPLNFLGGAPLIFWVGKQSIITGLIFFEVGGKLVGNELFFF